MKLRIRQLNLGDKVGSYKVQITRAYSYYGLVTGILAATAAREQLNAWFPWLPFWGILLALFVFLHIVMVIDFIFIRRAEITHNTIQSYIRSNPMMVDIKAMKSDIKSIKQHLGIEDLNDNSDNSDS